MGKSLINKNIIEEIRRLDKETPVDFLLRVMWEPLISLPTRIECAKSVAPYVHKKMPIDMNSTSEVTIIPPYVPSKEEIRKNYEDEIAEDDELFGV